MVAESREERSRTVIQVLAPHPNLQRTVGPKSDKWEDPGTNCSEEHP
jgi:hypothetical protein